jgi:hypothetical protein
VKHTSPARRGGRLAAIVTTVTLLAAPLAVVPATLGAPSAAAATTTQVTIKKIGTKTAPYKKKTTVKPSVSAKGNVSVKSKTLTVKKSGKTVAKNKKSVALKAGTYKVTTKVTYKTYKVKSTTKTVTKKKVGVAAYTDVKVSCKASVKDLGYDDYRLVTSCTSSKYDGARKVTLDVYDFGDEVWGRADNWDELTMASVPRQGATFSATLNPGVDLKKSYTVKQTTKKKVWSATKAKTKTQTLVVKQGKKPSRTTPVSKYNCPSWAPVKGNQSGIYHVPGGRYYKVTTPEECFTSAAAARNAGYRASKNG